MTAFLYSIGLHINPAPEQNPSLPMYHARRHNTSHVAGGCLRSWDFSVALCDPPCPLCCVFRSSPQRAKDQREKMVKLRYNLYGDGFARAENSGCLRSPRRAQVVLRGFWGARRRKQRGGATGRARVAARGGNSGHVCTDRRWTLATGRSARRHDLFATRMPSLRRSKGADRASTQGIWRAPHRNQYRRRRAASRSIRPRRAGDFPGCAEGRQASRRSRSISPPAPRQFQLNHEPAADMRAESIERVAGQAPKGLPRTVNGVSRPANPMAILASGAKSRLLKE